VGRGVDLGIDDAVAGTGEKADDAGKQIRLVLRVDHHLQAVAFLIGAGADDRLVVEDAVMQRTCVPGNFLCRVTQEIDGVELFPQAFMDGCRERKEAQQAHRFGLALGDHAMRGRRLALVELVQRGVVEIGQQLAFPVVPDLRAGPPDVGVGQQVERLQVTRIADQANEIGDHVRVGQVFLLGDLRHDQVIPDQPDDQFGIFRGQAVVDAEFAGIRGAELGVVAAASLGDVVEERGHIEQPGPIQFGDHARAQRVFVGELAHREAAQVAQHLQDMLVDGVDVEQVVLHLADDAPEIRQVAAQDVELVHPPEFVDDAAIALQQFKEGGPVDRVGPEIIVDQVAGQPHRTQRASRHADQFVVFLHDQEGIEDQVRVAVEDAILVDVEQIADRLEMIVQRLRNLLVLRCQRGAHVLQEDGVEQGDRFGVPVIELHQVLGGALGFVRNEAVLGGKVALVVKKQAIFTPTQHEVQANAQVAQIVFAAHRLRHALRGNDAVLLQLGPGRSVASCLGDPEDDLKIA